MMEHTDSARVVKLVPGTICTRDELIASLRCDPTTLVAWCRAGLMYFNAGTNADVFFVDDVFAFLRQFPVNDAAGERQREKIRELRHNRRDKDRK